MTLQFGTPEDDVSYRDRPASFGVAVRDGRLALVEVSKPGQPPWHDLPGGALDPGEEDAAAVVREFGEETGLVIQPGPLLTRADQVFRLADGTPVNNRSGIYRVDIVKEDASLKVEDDHRLVWLDPLQALTVMRHDSHAWAVACWLRRQAAA